MKLLRTVKMDGGCFVAGTLVHTKVGLKPVETIKVGDWVLSQPEEQGERVYRQVTNTFALGEKVIWLVGYYVVDPSMIEGGALEYVAVTGNHPFWVKDAGWTRADELYRDSKIEFHNGTHGYVLASRPLYRTHEANKAWVQGAHGIVANDWSGDFVCFDGGEICVTVDNISAPDIAYLINNDGVFELSNLFTRSVFNIEVYETHTYYIGYLGVWVHNSQGGSALANQHIQRGCL